ncbi:MAG: hypothetical protein IT440_08020 [Phycisphaeraceae bacterium]|nr:hypothetical protein [Phycisphaeraceae bacterium]
MDQPTHLLTVLTRDRVGIISGITSSLAAVEARVVQMSQTVVCDYFTIVVAVALSKQTDSDRLRDDIRIAIGGESLVVHIVPYVAGSAPVRRGERYILTGIGAYRPGVMHAITHAVADKGVNIVDLSAVSDGQRVTLVAELDVPSTVSLDQLQIDLTYAGQEYDLGIRLQHHRLFVAANEVAFRR